MSIVLIGMMGCGKSAIGHQLEKECSLKLIDADSSIEAMEGMAIKDIFEIYGEKAFRDMETNLLKSLMATKEIILSTGGGMVVREENRQLAASLGTVIYLRAQEETLVTRLSAEYSGRPMLKNDVEASVKSLLKQRETIYEESADYIVDVDNKNIESIIQEILSLVSVQ